jgi:uncharacterized caspase-like protein
MAEATSRAGAERDAYAVIVGIGRYRDSQIRQLKYACADAKALRDTLVDPSLGAFPEQNVKLLLDEEASLRNLKGAIGKWLFQQTRPESTVVIFFAGHGGLESDKEDRERDGLAKYLLPWDAERDDLFSTGLCHTEFQRLLAAVKSQSVVVFLDACYAAGVTAYGSRNIGIVEDVHARMAQGHGRLVIASAEPNQQSWEDDGLRHGIFTFHLLEALRGEGERDEDGCVSAVEVFRHLQRRVPDSARKLCNSNQQPVLRGEESKSIVLTLVAGMSPQATMKAHAPPPASPTTPAPRSRRTLDESEAGQRFCIACGTPIAPRQRFCTRCGRSVN